MRTISAKPIKGQEPPRTWASNLRLMRYIVSAGFNYLVAGWPIRRAWYAKQAAGEKYYVDEGHGRV